MTEITYRIVPRIKKRWFISNIKVYDVIKYYTYKHWDDPSYGNGDGNYSYYDIEKLLGSFETFMEAKQFKKELVNSSLI